MERFGCSTQIVTGVGSLAYLKELQIRRLFLVADPYFVSSGAAQHLTALSGAQESQVFSKIVPDPGVELAAEGTAQLKAFAPDTVVALGGGSAIDCAKAMVYFSGTDARFVAVPTTSGSGSEVTDFAILTHKDVKHPLVDGRLRPAVAILDGELLNNLPKALIADTGFDLLSHALEAYGGKNGGAFSDALAREAFCVGYAHLPASFAGQKEVRMRLHTASTMAGLAFTHAGLGLCHAMAHVLGGAFHIPHGRLNAILLPEILELNAHACGEKYARLARAAGLPGAADSVAVRNLKNGLIRLRRELELPGTLRQAGVEPLAVRRRSAELVKAVLEDPCCHTNPLPVEDFMVHRILEKVTGYGG